jgi:hypothetical protein
MAVRDTDGDRHATGRIRRVTRVHAEAVPASYPVSIDASHALVLEIERDGGHSAAGVTGGRSATAPGSDSRRGSARTAAGRSGETSGADSRNEDANSGAVRVFEAWPSGGQADSRLVRLLGAVGEPTTDPGALEGQRVALESRDERVRVDLDGTERLHNTASPPSVDTHSLTEVVVLAGAVTGLLAFLATQTPARWAAVPLAAVAAVTLVPSLGFDAWRTEDAAWSPRALSWAAGGAVPVLNVAVAVAYLARKAAVVEPPVDAAGVWRDVLVGTTVAFAGGLALAAFDPLLGVGATVFVHAWALAPVAVYLDGYSSRHERGPPNRLAWVAGATLFGGAGALIYLLRTDIV